MNYYFKIADIRIWIESELEINWNSYIRAFQCEEQESYEEHYVCICADGLTPEGTLVYRNQFQMIFSCGEYEERLHFFWGQKTPCMLYKEYEDRKVVYLSNAYRESFLREDNYSIFNAMAFEKVLMKHHAVVLHSSFIIWKGEAILFTAPSGTGKSTQAALWEKYKGAVIANGDRTILRIKDGKVVADGMPICGSSDICLNVEVPLKTIVYLSQAPENTVREVELKQAIKNLISETTINFFDRNYFEQALAVLTEIAEQTKMYHLFCTKEREAVEVLAAKLEELEDESD